MKALSNSRSVLRAVAAGTAATLFALTAAQAQENTVKVGLSSAFSGVIGFQGVDAKSGIELAIKHLETKNPDIDYELVIADDECTPAGGATAFRNLIDVEEVDVIIGPGCSGATLGGMPVLLEGAEVPAMTYGATHPAITTSGNPHMWRMNLNDAIIAKSFSRFIADDGVKTVHVLSVNNDFGRGASSVYEETLPDFGVQFTGAEFYTTGVTDLRNMMTKIAQVNPDAILFFGEPADCALLVRQKRELNIDVKLFSRGACYTDEALVLMGDPNLGNGLTEAAYWARTENQPMVEEYKEIHGRYPPYSAALAYYAMLTIDEAVKRGSPDRKGISKGLTEVDVELDIGRIKFDARNQAHPYLFMVQIRNGEGVVVETIKEHP